jgi:type II secretory pathway pseudopilin PulG
MLTVMSLIVVLAGLTVGGARYAQFAGKANRAKVELQALELALDAYKVDNGVYPESEDNYDADVNGLSGSQGGSVSLYTNLVNPEASGGTAAQRTYLELKRNQVAGLSIVDPWGNPYRYVSTNDTEVNINAPGVMLWSTAGGKMKDGRAETNKWIRNWE